MRILFNALLFFYVIAIPVCLCCCMEFRPSWFHFRKSILWIAGLSAFSWFGAVGTILIPAWTGFFEPRGPELCFAFFFGWLYLWIAGFPVFLIYGLFRMIRFIRNKITFSA